MQIGRYVVVDRLAIGGMAEVFLALDHGTHDLDRVIVIKRILPQLASDDAFVRMFLQEARVAARITHPNVVQIFELDEQDGLPFIAMEYVEGATLRDLLGAASRASQPMPLDVVIELMAQACAGAHAAHELVDPEGTPYGLVHRDLSPHNLIVSGNGHLKIVDFGIAKATTAHERTRTGMLKGKLRYMAPEQCNQLDLDRRCDVFTLGIVLWECLAGRRLFDGRTELQTMQAIVLGDIPRIETLRSDLSEALVAVVDRALAIDPDERFGTAKAMRKALLDAAATDGWSPSVEAVESFYDAILGAETAARRSEVVRARERTLTSLHAADAPTEELPLPTESSDPPTSTATAVGLMSVGAGAGATVALALVAISVAVYLVWRSGWFEPVEPVPTGPELVIAVAPTVDAESTTRDLQPLRLYLQRELDRPVRWALGDDYEATARQVASGEAPFAILPPYLYVLTQRQHPGVSAMAFTVVDGSSRSDAVLLVRDSSEAETVEELAGTTICYSDLKSTSGYLLPRNALRKAGLDPDEDLKAHISGTHQQALRDLRDDVCDVAGTFSANYLSADNAGMPAGALRVLAITGRTPHDAVCRGPSATDADAAHLTGALLAFRPEEHVGAERLGPVWRITSFEPAFEQRYDDIREAVVSDKQEQAP